MKKLATALLGSLLMITSVAGAATRIETDHFSLALTDQYHGGYYDEFSMQVLSSENGTVRIAMTGIFPIESWGSDMGYNTGNSQLLADIQDGYRVTSISLTGTMTGLAGTVTSPPSVVAGCPGCYYEVTSPAVSSNYASISWYARNDQSASKKEFYASDVNGVVDVSLAAGTDFSDPFTLRLHSVSEASTQAGSMNLYDAEGNFLGELDGPAPLPVYMAMNNIVLTVQVAPVPEPATYGMLLAGLGLVGFAARRRKA